jgi:hypothetical protein
MSLSLGPGNHENTPSNCLSPQYSILCLAMNKTILSISILCLTGILLLVAACGTTSLSMETESASDAEEGELDLSVFETYNEVIPEERGEPETLVTAVESYLVEHEKLFVFWEIDSYKLITKSGTESAEITPDLLRRVKSYLPITHEAIFEVADKDAANLGLRIGVSMKLEKDHNVSIIEWLCHYRLVETATKVLLGENMLRIKMAQITGQPEYTKLIYMQWE